jgi:hypothetical protein
MEYLHIGCIPSIDYQELKTSNILLDNNIFGTAPVSEYRSVTAMKNSRKPHKYQNNCFGHICMNRLWSQVAWLIQQILDYQSQWLTTLKCLGKLVAHSVMWIYKASSLFPESFLHCSVVWFENWILKLICTSFGSFWWVGESGPVW